MLIATACLEPIHRQRPDLRLIFAAREALRPLVEGHPLVDRFIAVPAPGRGGRTRAFRNLLGRGDLVAEVQAENADAVVHLHPDAGFQLACRAAGIPRRIGYRSGMLLDRWTLTDPCPDQRRTGHQHESQFNFGLLAPLGIVPPPVEALCPSVHLHPRWRESLRSKQAGAGWNPEAAPGDYLVINPTAYSPSLRWPPDRFVAAVGALRGEFRRVVLVAERADDPSVQAIRRELSSSDDARTWFTDLAGQTNLAELGWLLHAARLLISRNTGTAHLASAVGCPLVELFGRLEGIYGPGRWRALGAKTRVVVTPAADLQRRRGESKQTYWRRCHAAISAEEVVRAAHGLLALAR